MRTRPFGQRSGLQVPGASLGAMRFPQELGDAVPVIRHAIDTGMRYIDTCRRYGDSEVKLGEALRDGYRDKVILSSKWSPWVMGNEPDRTVSAARLRLHLEESLERLQTDYLDFYQIWNIDTPEHFAQAVAPGGLLDGIRQAMDEGLVRHTGFTTHDTVENLLGYLDQVPWCEVILFSYNMLNRYYRPAIEAAHARGIGTIIMNPVGGGTLAQPSAALERLAAEVDAADVPDLALRYLLSHESIDTFICGVHRPSDADAAIAAAERGAFPADVLAHIEATLDALEAEAHAFCTGCRYCLPCPQQIDIPAVMGAIADARIWGRDAAARERYAKLDTPAAAACTRCAACEDRCTQHLPISDQMTWAASFFGEKG